MSDAPRVDADDEDFAYQPVPGKPIGNYRMVEVGAYEAMMADLEALRATVERQRAEMEACPDWDATVGDLHDNMGASSIRGEIWRQRASGLEAALVGMLTFNCLNKGCSIPEHRAAWTVLAAPDAAEGAKP